MQNDSTWSILVLQVHSGTLEEGKQDPLTLEGGLVTIFDYFRMPFSGPIFLGAHQDIF